MTTHIRTLCIAPDGHLRKAEINQLQLSISALYRQHFGEEYKLAYIWLLVPEDQLFLAAQVSTTCTIQIPVMDNLPNDLRHAFMRDCCKAWMEITVCNKNEIICAAQDMSYTQNYSAQLTGRLRPSMRLLTAAKMSLRLLSSKITKGYLSINANYST